MFAEKTDCGVPSADDGMTDVLDKSREVVLVDDVSLNDGFTYYEQFHVAAGWIKLGLFTDFCHAVLCISTACVILPSVYLSRSCILSKLVF